MWSIYTCAKCLYCVKCVTFVSETFTWYGSNIMNVWQEILTPMTLAFSCEVVHEKLWKSVNICKSCGEKISGTFFMWTRCIILVWKLPKLRSKCNLLPLMISYVHLIWTTVVEITLVVPSLLTKSKTDRLWGIHSCIDEKSKHLQLLPVLESVWNTAEELLSSKSKILQLLSLKLCIFKWWLFLFCAPDSSVQ